MTKQQIIDSYVHVSVPLRGYGFEIPQKRNCCASKKLSVSVPLRGYGFEIFKKSVLPPKDKLFPSPYGDMVLKLLEIDVFGFFFERSFRPLTGIWF